MELNEKYKVAIDTISEYFKDNGYNLTPWNNEHEAENKYAYKHLGIYNIKLGDSSISFRFKTNWFFNLTLARMPSLCQFYIITEGQEDSSKWKVVPSKTIETCMKWSKRKDVETPGSVKWSTSGYSNGTYKSLTNIKNFLYLDDFKKILFKQFLIGKNGGLSTYNINGYFPYNKKNRTKDIEDRMTLSPSSGIYVKHSEAYP